MLQQINNMNPVDESIPCFIRKTYKILEDGNYSDIISWNADGTAIVIKNPSDFAQNVLPIYFKHNNLNSFIRQLNMYDFHKRKTPDGEHVYFHELFQRDKKDLLKNIKRKSAENSGITNEKVKLGQELSRTKQDIAAIINENLTLKRVNQDNLAMITTLEAKANEMTLQNQMLWNQIVKLNEKEDLLSSYLPNLRRDQAFSIQPIDLKTTKLPPLTTATKLGQTTTRIPYFSSDPMNQRNWNLLGDNIQELHIPNLYTPALSDSKVLGSDDRRNLSQKTDFQGTNYQDNDIAMELSQQIVRNLDQELQYLKRLTSYNERANNNMLAGENPDNLLLGKRRTENDSGQGSLAGSYEGFTKYYKPDNLSGVGFIPGLYKPDGEELLMNYEQLGNNGSLVL